jgi:IclR family acetate operon transcriptional repressor
MDKLQNGADKTPSMEPDAPKGTQAVIRAVHLLKAVSRAPNSMTLHELCDEVGLSKPTAHRILAALTSEGLLEQDPISRNFRVGPEAIDIGAHAMQRGGLRSAARPFLESLAASTGETATLEIPIQNEMLILDEVSGRHLIGARAEIGTRWPMHATSTGKALLASLSPEEFESKLGVRRERFTKATLVDIDKFRKAIMTVRRNGFAVVAGELELDYCAVAAAILRHGQIAIGALSIGGPRERLPSIRRTELGALVRKAADGLSESFGG